MLSRPETKARLFRHTTTGLSGRSNCRDKSVSKGEQTRYEILTINCQPARLAAFAPSLRMPFHIVAATTAAKPIGNPGRTAVSAVTAR
jgi:hypothetical protein